MLTWLLRRARQEALRAMPKNLPGRPPEVDSEVVENLINPEQRTLLDAVYFRGQLTDELTGDKSGIDTNLRERLRVVLQELKLVFTQ